MPEFDEAMVCKVASALLWFHNLDDSPDYDSIPGKHGVADDFQFTPETFGYGHYSEKARKLIAEVGVEAAAILVAIVPLPKGSNASSGGQIRKWLHKVIGTLSRDYLIAPRNSGEERDAAADLAMCEAATKGPWQPHFGAEFVIETGESRVYYTVLDSEHNFVCDATPDESDKDLRKTIGRANRKFIASSRTALPYWIKQAVALRKVQEAAEGVCDKATICDGPAGYRDVHRKYLDALKAALKESPHG